MSYAPSFHDNQPLLWFRRVPVYLTTILCALMIVGMFATAFFGAASVSLWPLSFSTFYFWQHGWLWQVVTYPFLGSPSFFYLFSVLFFGMAGTEVEKYLGRIRFLKLYAVIVAVPVVIFGVWSLAVKMAVGGAAGPYYLAIGMFVAFATLYPNLEMWGFVPLKWFAFAGIVLDLMNHLPKHDWPGVTILLTTCAVAFGFIKFLQLGGSLELPHGFVRNLFRRKPKFRVLPRPGDKKPPRVIEVDPVESIDPLLDKIAKQGLKSLTARERERLERVSSDLSKKQPDR